MSQSSIRNREPIDPQPTRGSGAAGITQNAHLDHKTALLANKMHEHLRKRSEQQLIALRRGAARYVKDPADIPLMFDSSAKARFPRPTPDVVAALVTSRLATAWSPCLEFAAFPPFVTGSPLPPGVTITAPGSTSVVGFSEAVPETGELSLQAVTYKDDPTSTHDASGFAYKQMNVFMTAVMDTISPTFTSQRLNVAAVMRVGGYTVGLGQGGVQGTGTGLVWLMLRLAAGVASRNEVVEDDELPVCRLYGPPPFGSYNPLETKFDETVPLSVQLDVAPGDRVVVGISAELYLGVSSESNLYLIGNFAPLSGLWLPRASLRLQGVIGSC